MSDKKTTTIENEIEEIRKMYQSQIAQTVKYRELMLMFKKKYQYLRKSLDYVIHEDIEDLKDIAEDVLP